MELFVEQHLEKGKLISPASPPERFCTGGMSGLSMESQIVLNAKPILRALVDSGRIMSMKCIRTRNNCKNNRNQRDMYAI